MVKLTKNEDDRVVLREESFGCHSVKSAFNVFRAMIFIQSCRDNFWDNDVTSTYYVEDSFICIWWLQHRISTKDDHSKGRDY